MHVRKVQGLTAVSTELAKSVGVALAAAAAACVAPPAAAAAAGVALATATAVGAAATAAALAPPLWWSFRSCSKRDGQRCDRKKPKQMYHEANRANGCGDGCEGNKERQDEEEFEHGDVDSALHVEEEDEEID